MNYAQALDVINNGGAVTRDTWNGDGYRSFIFLVPGSEFVVNRAPLLGIFEPGTKVRYRSHVDMVYPDGSVGTWHGFEVDFKATDWTQVDLQMPRPILRSFAALTPTQRQLWDEGRN